MKELKLLAEWADSVIGVYGKSVLVEGKGHLDHPEDDVFTKTDSGATAIASILNTAKNPSNITIKWDGYPALLFGRGADGKFTIVDKHMFNRGVRNLNSIEDWIAYETARGEKSRTELIEIIKEIWPGLEKAVVGNGYYWGDLLFRSPLKAQNGIYTFRANPNGITYKVDANSDIGKLLSNKQAGIAVHQYLQPDAATTDDAVSLNGGTGNLKNNSNVAIVPSAMPMSPTIKVDRQLLSKAKTSVSKYGPIVERFLNNAPQNRNTFSQLFTTYVNARIVSGNLRGMTEGFVQWLERRLGGQVDTSKVSQGMGGRIHDYVVSNENIVRAAFQIWTDLYNLKNSIVGQLDAAVSSSPVKGYLDSGQETHEGFVSNGYKFVNRMGFARQNLAGRPQPVNESTGNRRVIVVYGGGFQPFHAGHLSGYLQAKRAFPNADFFVAASNDTKNRPIPFDVKKFLAQQAGVVDDFVQVKTPINPREILDRYDPNKDIFVLVRSERDPVSYTKKDGTPGYYQPLTDISQAEPFGKHGYVFVSDRHDFQLEGEPVYSGTQVRKMYAQADDAGKMRIIGQLYRGSKKPELIKQQLDKYLDGLTEGEIPPTDSGFSPLSATTRDQPRRRHSKPISAKFFGR